MPAANLQQLLHSTFGFAHFRANQQAVCEAAANGRDVLLVMPTGAGKSLCYQLPALARGGTALVISPLIALMDDQANKLQSLGLRVGRIHSGMSREHSREVCREYLQGTLQFLFIAPERLRVPGFADMLRKRPLALIAVDEAHCISQWGHDFRPDYRNLARHLESLRPAPVIALTATATPQVQRDIVSELRLANAAEFITGFRRTNLAVEVAEVSKPRRKEMALKLLADSAQRPAIIYAPSRKDAEELAGELHRHFPTAAYHAGLPPQQREQVQSDFLGSRLQVVVATIAFGMGIDKADVRTVLHMAMPASVESYYQEIGRAGRDGRPARAVLLYSYADRKTHEFFLDRDYPPVDTLGRIAQRLGDTPIHADDLRISLKLDMDTFAPALDKLLAQGAAEIDFGGSVVRAAGPQREWRSGYESQVSFRRGQIDAMMRFASGAECRMAALIRHFGDRSDASRTCGLCDFCSPERATAAAVREPDAAETREMLRALRELSKTPSRSTGKLYTELHPRQQIDRRDFDALLDALGRAGYLSIESATFEDRESGREISYRKASLTHEGREVAAGNATLGGVQLRGMAETASAGTKKAGTTKAKSSARKAKQERDEMQPLTAGQKQTEGTLRTWRAGVAATLKQPAFCVFSDKVMRNIVLDAPESARDLEGISGLGKVKVERWGNAILGALRGELAADSASSPAETRRRPEPMSQKRDMRHPGLSAAPHRSDLELSAPASPLAPAASLDHQLKVWRMHEAKRRNVAPFVLLLDQTARNIAAAQPETTGELARVSGVSTDWAEQFGDAICSLVSRHIEAGAAIAER